MTKYLPLQPWDKEVKNTDQQAQLSGKRVKWPAVYPGACTLSLMQSKEADASQA